MSPGLGTWVKRCEDGAEIAVGLGSGHQFGAGSRTRRRADRRSRYTAMRRATGRAGRAGIGIVGERWSDGAGVFFSPGRSVPSRWFVAAALRVLRRAVG